MNKKSLIYYCDVHRHLVCYPYSIEALHAMAIDLNINRCWFHGDHYDIPKTRVMEIKKKCIVVRPRSIVQIIKGTEDNNTFSPVVIHSNLMKQSGHVGTFEHITTPGKTIFDKGYLYGSDN